MCSNSGRGARARTSEAFVGLFVDKRGTGDLGNFTLANCATLANRWTSRPRRHTRSGWTSFARVGGGDGSLPARNSCSAVRLAVHRCHSERKWPRLLCCRQRSRAFSGIGSRPPESRLQARCTGSVCSFADSFCGQEAAGVCELTIRACTLFSDRHIYSDLLITF